MLIDPLYLDLFQKEVKNNLYETNQELKTQIKQLSTYDEQVENVMEGMIELNQKLKAQGTFVYHHTHLNFPRIINFSSSPILIYEACASLWII